MTTGLLRSLLAVATLLVLLPACETPPADTAVGPPAPAPLSPILARMQRAYSDLAAGRFVSLADFEIPGQVPLFRMVDEAGNEGDRSQPTLSILRSRNETGAGSLKATFAAPTDVLLFDGERSKQYALLRDWRPYTLLLMSLYGPPGGTTLELSVQSGFPIPLRWTRTLRVEPGWNLVRLDLATIGDALDLANVRAIGWRAPQADAPVELYLDDVILADNTRTVVDGPAGQTGLRVVTRGQRICVGVKDRFELEFAAGQIVAWRDPVGDSLTDVGGLGPWPVPLAADWAAGGAAPAYDDPQWTAAWGPAAATNQRLVEATPNRVVIEGAWLFPASSDQPAASNPAEWPGHTWRYAIYPTGEIAVHLRSRPGPSGWPTPRVGYALGVDGRRGFEFVPAASTVGVNGVLLTRRGKGQADLFWTWPAAQLLPRARILTSLDERRLALLAGDVAADGIVETTHLLRVWPSDLDAAPEAESLAADYQTPAHVAVTSGRLLTDEPGDADHDGYNEGELCTELEPADHVLRFTYDPGSLVRFDPLVRVQQTEGRRCWVYVNGRALTNVGRDGGDRVLITLAHVVNAPVLVEVHLSPP